MDGLALLAEAEAVGLVVAAEGGRLVIEGPRAAEAVAERLIAHKRAVLAALATAGSRVTGGEATVWWRDPAVAPPRPGADGWDRQTRASFSPILWLPPRRCLGPRLCSRLGPCERSRGGLPCRADE